MRVRFLIKYHDLADDNRRRELLLIGQRNALIEHTNRFMKQIILLHRRILEQRDTKLVLPIQQSRPRDILFQKQILYFPLVRRKEIRAFVELIRRTPELIRQIIMIPIRVRVLNVRVIDVKVIVVLILEMRLPTQRTIFRCLIELFHCRTLHRWIIRTSTSTTTTTSDLLGRRLFY